MANLPDSLAADEPDESSGPPGPEPACAGGLSWSWDLDLATLLDAVSDPAPWRRGDDAGAAGAAADGGSVPTAVPTAELTSEPRRAGSVSEGADDPEADEAAYQEARAAGRVREVPLEWVAGRIAESLPTGPGLASWLWQARAADLEDGALAGVAASFRRLASWAAAGELAAVAQIASRSARSDRRAEVDDAGRPDRVTADAAGQVSLALAMSHDGATSWADLGVMLTWRLPGTGAALASGQIDLGRARMIVRVTSALSDEAARQVEAAVLPRAGWLTLGQLHAALRRAVIKADPEGAERRRRQAERNAAVALYPEDEGTATLAGYSLPGVEAAAAMARITVLARAMKAAGSDGQIDWLRAHVFLGLLLGTLPLAPTADSPPDVPPSDSSPPQMPPPTTPPPDTPPPATSPPDTPPPATAPPDTPPASGSNPPCTRPPCTWPPGSQPPGAGHPAAGQRNGWPPDSPQTGSVPGSPEPGTGSPSSWPGVRPYLPSWLPAASGRSGPAGLLNLTVPLATLSGGSSAPGQLSWLGVITAGQARQLAALAARHPATSWRVVVTNSAGQAVAVAHVPRSRSPARARSQRVRSGRPREPDKTDIGLIGRVTLVVKADELAHGPPSAAARPGATRFTAGADLNGADLNGADLASRGWPGVMGAAAPRCDDAALAVIMERAQAAACRAAEAAARREEHDQRSGGCTHELASSAYRPPPRISELVTARDGTCRFGPCRRPAEQCDLDHTVPFDQGGLTCSCNIGGECRSHHQLKQHPRWSLGQSAAGVFMWTTPAGRRYVSLPDMYCA